MFEGKDYSKEPSAADCHAFQQLIDGIYLLNPAVCSFGLSSYFFMLLLLIYSSKM